MFVGTTGAPAGHCGTSGTPQPYVTVDEAPKIAEKPFVFFDTKSDMYYLKVPSSQTNRTGVDHSSNGGVAYPFSQVYVADAQNDTAESINAKLSQGKHVVLSPGIYHLQAPLKVSKKNQVLLGLGLASLVSSNGSAVIQVGNVDGVRVAGLLL